MAGHGAQRAVRRLEPLCAEEIAGDWVVRPRPPLRRHLGEVYLNGLSFYEVASRHEVTGPPLRTEVVDDWTRITDRVLTPSRRRLVWYAEVGADTTTLWANFAGADPNAELVEINVRRSVFYPADHHLDYITVRGFELAHAAMPVGPADRRPARAHRPELGQGLDHRGQRDPRREVLGRLPRQGGLDRRQLLRRCAATSPATSTSSSPCSPRVKSAGTASTSARTSSAATRSSTAGRTAIVGHLGCVFSTIEDNHIHNIAVKREFYGHEIGGIKLHAAIDVEIRHNRIHDCSLGTWLDWQTQGTRVTRNLSTATTGTCSSR